MTEFLRMSGIYWGVTALDLMDNVDKIDQDEIVEYIKKCQCAVSGGISPCEGHDPHLLYTLSAVQVTYLLLVKSTMPFSLHPIHFDFFTLHIVLILFSRLTAETN